MATARRHSGRRPYVALREPFTVQTILAGHHARGVTLTDVDTAAIAGTGTPPWLDGAGLADVRCVRSRPAACSVPDRTLRLGDRTHS
ncbi:hypothetical protein JOF29_006057 [Kribbella aluminosa]|uniref:Uncharacterized protein n=1 Tax=Kribbella aluminosa TaxID=416017 RepID=A0ABS4UTI3_9ACTN|nr:hypothetical protein [Kribbella aluminosa]MBP2354947.1 hypothetical protein [Kribbella aluminosa]